MLATIALNFVFVGVRSSQVRFSHSIPLEIQDYVLSILQVNFYYTYLTIHEVDWLTNLFLLLAFTYLNDNCVCDKSLYVIVKIELLDAMEHSFSNELEL